MQTSKKPKSVKSNFQILVVLQLILPAIAYAHATVPFSLITRTEAAILFIVFCILPCIYTWRTLKTSWLYKSLTMLPVLFFGFIVMLMAAGFIEGIKIDQLKSQYANDSKK